MGLPVMLCEEAGTRATEMYAFESHDLCAKIMLKQLHCDDCQRIDMHTHSNKHVTMQTQDTTSDAYLFSERHCQWLQGEPPVHALETY